MGALHAVSHYTGLNWQQNTDNNGIKGELRLVSKLGFSLTSSSFFSCCDSRSQYAVLGTPGGDIGEFILALGAVEYLLGRVYNADEVSLVFQDYLQVMSLAGKKHFYMHTDMEAEGKLSTASGVFDVRNPVDHVERNKLITLSTNPDHVGCQHLKGLLTDSASYGIRKELVEDMIKAFLNIFYDSDNPLSSSLLYVTLKPPTRKTSGLYIYAPDRCHGAAPEIVPDTGNSSSFVYHHRHVIFYRQDLIRYLSWKNSDIDSIRLDYQINRIATLQGPKVESTYGNGKSYDVIFSEPINHPVPVSSSTGTGAGVDPHAGTTAARFLFY